VKAFSVPDKKNLRISQAAVFQVIVRWLNFYFCEFFAGVIVQFGYVQIQVYNFQRKLQ
jgi:hypothetical protein